ncbi:MAG: Pvc16 family protein [Cyanobium sp.]
MSRVLPDTLEVVRRRVNQFLLNAEQRSDDWVVLSNALEPDGSPSSAALNKIVMTVTNIGRELSHGHGPGQQLDVIVDLAFIANFAAAQYGDGLTALSLVIACLHQQPLLTPQTASSLPAEVEKLSLEMINLTAADLNHHFGTMGLKYQPSVFYRLRLLPYLAASSQSRQLPVRGGGSDPFLDAG